MAGLVRTDKSVLGWVLEQGSLVGYRRSNECGCRFPPSFWLCRLAGFEDEMAVATAKMVAGSTRVRHRNVTPSSHLLLPRLQNDVPLCPIQTKHMPEQAHRKVMPLCVAERSRSARP